MHPLRLFVAMPYRDFGPNAKWPNPEHVKDFYKQVCSNLSSVLNREVQLEIEIDRGESGVVHQAMFGAAYEADFFIADLTGANANVFFELGVRYSVRRSVTVLTSQEGRILFNINSLRVVSYGDRPDHLAINEIVEMLRHGFEHPDHCDSPILSLLDLHVDSRKRWERISGERVRALLALARNSEDPEAKLEYLQQAVRDDPSSIDARLKLAGLYRLRQDYGSALSCVKKALERFPMAWELYKEQGLILDRMAAAGEDCLDEAIESMKTALTLHDGDADFHCCLGGVFRRRGLKPDNPEREQDLKDAYAHYQRAVRMERYNTYAGINLLRLLLIQSKQSQNPDGTIPPYIQRMYHLCAFEVADAEVEVTGQAPGRDQQWWNLFDFGDMLAFQEERDEALKTYQQAIDLVPKLSRDEVLLSPMRTWKELLDAQTLKREIRETASEIVGLLERQTG